MIIVTYACRPDGGSEHSNGWNWCKAAIDHMDLNNELPPKIITSLTNKPYIPSEYVKYFIFVAPSAIPKTFIDLHVYLNYFIWQLKVARIVSSHRGVVWHITYGSLFISTIMPLFNRNCFYGPIGGGQKIPSSLAHYLPRSSFKDKLRNVAISLLRYSILHRLIYSRLRGLLVTNKETENLSRYLGCKNIIFECDSGITEVKSLTYRKVDRFKRLIWIGRMYPFKGLNIALNLVKQLPEEFHMDVYGGGPEEKNLHLLARELGIEHRVHFHGYAKLTDITSTLSDQTLHMFFSLRDSFGSQILEMAAVGVPTISFNINGFALFLADSNAVKIEPESFDFATVANLIKQTFDKDSYAELSDGALDFAKTQIWDVKIGRVLEVFEQYSTSSEGVHEGHAAK